jgi:hypothetical protein
MAIPGGAHDPPASIIGSELSVYFAPALRFAPSRCPKPLRQGLRLFMHKKPQYPRDVDNPSVAVLDLSGWGYAGSGLYNALGRAVVLPHLSGAAFRFAH